MYYRIMSDKDKYANYKAVKASNEFSRMFDGRSLQGAGLEGMHFVLVKPGDRHAVPEFFTSSIMVCAKRVYEAIKDNCGDNVEFFKCTLGDKKLEYYIVNIMNTGVGVNYEHSEFIQLPTPEKIVIFKRIALNKEVKTPMFRVDDLAHSHFFCTEEMKERLEGLHIKGLRFSTELFDGKK